MTDSTPPAGLAAELLTPDEAARALGIGLTKLYRLIKTGELGSLKISGRLFVTRGQLDRYILKLEQA
jgi:excisionase family DNA binding protein